MNKKVRMILPVAISGLFLLFDQVLKHTAQTYPNNTWYIMKPWLGWEYFENTGIAFSLPFPNTLLLIVTPLILLFLVHFLLHKKTLTPKSLFGISLIIAGAISNFIDRMLFGFTIDYLRILTSIMNLADTMIVLGAVLVIFSSKSTVPEKL